MNEHDRHRRGETLIDSLMSWVAPIAGGILAAILAARLGASLWLVILCAVVGMFAGQLLMVTLLKLLGRMVSRPR